MKLVQLGQSDLQVTPICLGTMTFGQQVNEADSHTILDRSLEAGINFIDTAEMYAVPASADTCGATETIVGNWLASRPGAREKIVLAALPELSLQIVEFAREHGRITMGDAIRLTSGNRNTLKQHFRGLVEQGHLAQRGAGRGAWYELVQ